jgi:uridylate kinase
MLIKKTEPPIVISVGGSLIVPDGGVNTVFLDRLNKLIRSQVVKGRRFLLVAGGGKIARQYIEAGREVIGNVTNEDLDWLGIHATRFNAHLLRTIFQDIANPRIVINYEKKIEDWKEPVAIGAGWKPGWSTDYDAVILARDYKASVVINLSNIDGVYDKDPKKFKDARIIKKITWEEMEKIVGTKWSPGMNAPFDSTATKLAKSIGLTAIVAAGHDFQNLENIIEGEPFKGTVIMPFTVDAGFYDRDYFRGKKGGHRIRSTESFWGSVFHNAMNFMRAASIKYFINPKNCLDVGCGMGYLVKWLRFFGIDAYGIDFSPHAKQLVPPKIQRYVKVADVSDIPYDDNSFDLVVSYNLLQHLEMSKIKGAIKETIRVSRKHIFHKILTPDSLQYLLFHYRDFSNVSFFFAKYWKKIFDSIESVSLVDKLPVIFFDFSGAKFLLKKKAK